MILLYYTFLAAISTAQFLPYSSMIDPHVPNLTIQRYLSPSPLFHYYQVVNNTFPTLQNASYFREEDVGRVTAELPPTTTCTSLISVTRFEQTIYPFVSFFATSPPINGTFIPRETFYCSSVQNNCGATFELTLFPSVPITPNQVADYFYPSNPAELAMMKLGILNYLKNGTTICYIWK